ncbi:tyrosine-type recombinase/integrase [Dyella subtropica]|uniref:tyrosine-type recombinase/integrase n=1 Tax=Dyella subtropica TaxID=2992127 RepID=UPI00224F18C6|nr:hypothetical protein [Dyella subtropica]
MVKRWAASVGLQPADYGTHSMRRTKPTLIYRRTHNLRAVQLLLGHTKLESTVRYLAIEVEDALALAATKGREGDAGCATYDGARRVDECAKGQLLNSGWALGLLKISGSVLNRSPSAGGKLLVPGRLLWCWVIATWPLTQRAFHLAAASRVTFSLLAHPAAGAGANIAAGPKGGGCGCPE